MNEKYSNSGDIYEWAANKFHSDMHVFFFFFSPPLATSLRICTHSWITSYSSSSLIHSLTLAALHLLHTPTGWGLSNGRNCILIYLLATCKLIARWLLWDSISLLLSQIISRVDIINKLFTLSLSLSFILSRRSVISSHIFDTILSVGA